MSLLDSALEFVDGMRSVIGASGAIQGAISNSLADGIERAFRRIRRPLEQSVMKISFIFVSVLFIVWGMAILLDSFLPYHGLGFVLVGVFFGLLVLVFNMEKGTG